MMSFPLKHRPNFKNPAHQAIIHALQEANVANLNESKCLFGRGTAIVLDIGEYRVSKDVDFLCSDDAGYRYLRSRIHTDGLKAIFGPKIQQERDFRFNHYGMRTMISVGGIPIRLEIVREGRISLEDGVPHPQVPVTTLSVTDRVTEKLLANSDRTHDRSTAYRDAIDLGMLFAHGTPLTKIAIAKAAQIYDDIGLKAQWTASKLADTIEQRHVADSLNMTMDNVRTASHHFRRNIEQNWPMQKNRQKNKGTDFDR